MKDDEYNYEDIGYLWDKRTDDKKNIAGFFSFSLSWTVGMDTLTSERPLGRTRLGRSFWTALFRLCSYGFVFFLLFLKLIYRGWPRL